MAKKRRLERIEHRTDRLPERNLKHAEVGLAIETGRGHEALQTVGAEANADVGEENVAGNGERVIDRLKRPMPLRHPIDETPAVDIEKTLARVRKERRQIDPPLSAFKPVTTLTTEPGSY